MGNFELPTSTHVATERTPPEVEELCLLLREAVITIPDVAPVLVLGAATGMRRGELVGLRRSRIRWQDLRLTEAPRVQWRVWGAWGWVESAGWGQAAVVGGCPSVVHAILDTARRVMWTAASMPPRR